MSRATWCGAAAVLCAVALTALSAGAQQAPPKDEEKIDNEGRVILNWETFRKITEHERAAGEPKLVLPWKEVQTLLGVEVEGVADAQVTLDWQQFKALLQWSVERRKPKVVPVPADYVIASADYSGTLRKEGAVFELALAVDVLKQEGWKRIPLLPAGVALEQAKLPDNCFLNASEKGYEMLTEGAGRMQVSLRFAAAVAEEAGAFRTRFNTMPGGTTVLKLTVASPGVTVTVAGAQAVLPLEAKQGETVVGVSLPSGAPVQITWERALEVMAKVPPSIYAETLTLVAVGEGVLTCRERVNLSVLHSGIRSVVLLVPQQASVLEVTGRDVYDWRVSEGKLEVRFTRDVTGNAWIAVTFEQVAGKQQAQSPVPVLRVEEAVREKGYIGVVALANVEITAPESPGVATIDARELPAEILQMTGQPVLLAFRYVGKEFSIALSVRKHEDVPVLLTIVDSSVLTIMQTMDGKRITKAIYNVRNNRNQFLRLTLPKGAEVWSATVAGRSIRPAADEQGRVLIPLVRSSTAAAEMSSFPVEMVYVEQQPNVAAAGSMRVDLPTVDEPVTHLMAQLYLPAEGGYKTGLLGAGGLSFAGPLRRVEAFSSISSAPTPPQPQLDAAAQAGQMQQQMTQRLEEDARAAGVTPIRVQLPVRGSLFRFEKILVFKEELWISFDYSGWSRN